MLPMAAPMTVHCDASYANPLASVGVGHRRLGLVHELERSPVQPLGQWLRIRRVPSPRFVGATGAGQVDHRNE